MQHALALLGHTAQALHSLCISSVSMKHLLCVLAPCWAAVGLGTGHRLPGAVPDLHWQAYPSPALATWPGSDGSRIHE